MSSRTLNVSAIDAHVAGSVLRLVTRGLPVPEGASMADKARWLERRHARTCDALLGEPRGHDAMTLAVLCEPVDGGSDAGVLFRRRGSFAPFGGQNLIALATIALERGLILPRNDHLLRVDTAIGTIEIRCDLEGRPGKPRVQRASYVGPPAFVLAGGLEMTVSGRRLRADVAHGGELFVIVDSESAGVPLARAHLPELLRMAAAVQQAAAVSLALPQAGDDGSESMPAVIFTGPPSGGEAQLRCQVVYANGTPDRSPSGAAVAALLAVLDAMGLVSDEPLTIESMAGTSLTGRILGSAGTVPTGEPLAPASASSANPEPAGSSEPVRIEIAGRAWIVADLELTLDPADPLRDGLTW
jgi:proline racemase